MSDLERLLARLATAPAVLVTVQQVQGSTPRENGAWMAVFGPGAADTDTIGTIGGGHLEYQAQNWARAQLHPGTAAQGAAPGPVDALPAEGRLQRQALGPSLGQCCGGVVQLRYERVDAAQIDALRLRLTAPRWPLALYGAGHVARALVQLLSPLPWQLHWIDSREDFFPPCDASQVRCEQADPVQATVPELVSGSRVLIMSYSHAEDLALVAACLQRQRERGDLPFIGLIGSRSKWASFRHRLQARGWTAQELDQVHCPIGVPGIASKEPAVIAVAVAAQLLQTLGTA